MLKALVSRKDSSIAYLVIRGLYAFRYFNGTKSKHGVLLIVTFCQQYVGKVPVPVVID